MYDAHGPLQCVGFKREGAESWEGKRSSEDVEDRAVTAWSEACEAIRLKWHGLGTTWNTTKGKHICFESSCILLLWNSGKAMVPSRVVRYTLRQRFFFTPLGWIFANGLSEYSSTGSGLDTVLSHPSQSRLYQSQLQQIPEVIITIPIIIAIKAVT